MIRYLAVFIALLGAAPVWAQERVPSHCVALADATPGLEYIVPARFGAGLAPDTVRLSYVDHSTFVLETAGGLVAATDFTGFLGNVAVTPDVVTMNNAHDTHWTPFPDPAIPHVLEGWAKGGQPADHRLDLGEMLVRNVPTDTRGRAGAVRVAGNSIFVFEVAGLCIGHLGHLHHEPDAAQYTALGRMDVVMTPVDGSMTLDQPTMIAVLKRLRASVVIPMHWFGDFTLERFLQGMEESFQVVRSGESSLEIALHKLPAAPTVMVLEPAWLRRGDD